MYTAFVVGLISQSPIIGVPQHILLEEQDINKHMNYYILSPARLIFITLIYIYYHLQD